MAKLDGLPATVELRCREDVIDSVIASEDSDFAALAADLIDAAEADALTEGKTRNYTIVAINARDERYLCRQRIRRRVDKSAGDLVGVLAKQNAELHALLTKKETQTHKLLLEMLAEMRTQNQALSEEANTHRNRAGEVIDKLESLRSKQLERDLVIEKHKADLDIKERAADAFLPLAMAIGAKFSKGALPAPDMQQHMLSETVKGLGESQLTSIETVLGDDWPEFHGILNAVLNEHVDVQAFKRFVARLPQEKVMSVFQLLNMGQQAAVKEILTDGRGN